MRLFHLVATVILTAALIVQLYLAGFAVFGVRAETGGFNAHAVLGTFVLPAASLLVLVSAALAKLGKRAIRRSSVPLILVVSEFLLFVIARLLGSETHPGGASFVGALVLGLHALIGVGALAAAILILRAGIQDYRTSRVSSQV